MTTIQAVGLTIIVTILGVMAVIGVTLTICEHFRNKEREKATDNWQSAIARITMLQRDLAICEHQLKVYKEAEKDENERLKAKVSVKKKLLKRSSDLVENIKADTVREFAERLKKECLVDSGYEVLQIGTIDRIAKEMTEPKTEECTDCKHFVGCECFDGKVCDLYEKK